jgi:DNA-directed RNA polymerase subunit M
MYIYLLSFWIFLEVKDVFSYSKGKKREEKDVHAGAFGISFCPKDGKRLIPLKKKQGRMVVLRLSCPKCGYEKRAMRPMTIVAKTMERPPREHVLVIDKKQQKLRTLAKVRIECPRCGNGSAYAWMVQIRRLEESSTQFFRCTKCGYTFRENS